MQTLFGIVLALLVLLPMLAWIGALVWAALRDGRDEADRRHDGPTGPPG